MNHNTFHRFRFAPFLICAAALMVACGGGGGSSEPSNGDGSTPVASITTTYTSISGVVAYGHATAGAEVSLSDLEGKLASVITDAMGGFMIPLSTLTRALKPPFTLQAKFQVADRAFNLLSISQGDQGGDVRMNVTPITDMITRAYLTEDGGDPMSVDLESPIPDNPTRLRRIIDNAKEMFGSKLPTDVRDFTSEYFKTSPTQYEMDALLERVKVEIDSTGVTLKTALDKVLAKRSLAQMRSDQSRRDDASTITDAEAAVADADRGELPLGEQVAANLLPVALPDEVVVEASRATNLVLKGRNATGFTITQEPAHGRLEVVDDSAGLFIYVAPVGWTGTDEFKFSTSNAYGASRAEWVRLRVSNDCVRSTSTSGNAHRMVCAQRLTEAPRIISPAAGYPFGLEPTGLDAGGDPLMLTTYDESSEANTNVLNVSGLDIWRESSSYDSASGRYVVTHSGGFYQSTTGERLPAYTRPFTRSHAVYARHPSQSGHVLTGYAEADMSYEFPIGFDEPYEFGVLTQYSLQGFSVTGRPLYVGTRTVCILEPVSIPFTLFSETVTTWGPTGEVRISEKRTNNCSISIDQLSSVAFETRPADLRHTGS